MEKGRYETVEQGIQLAVDVYVKELQEQKRKKNLTVFVHPITPVLDVTRPTVKKFTQQLKDTIALTSSTFHTDWIRGGDIALPSMNQST